MNTTLVCICAVVFLTITIVLLTKKNKGSGGKETYISNYLIVKKGRFPTLNIKWTDHRDGNRVYNIVKLQSTKEFEGQAICGDKLPNGLHIYPTFHVGNNIAHTTIDIGRGDEYYDNSLISVGDDKIEKVKIVNIHLNVRDYKIPIDLHVIDLRS